MQGIKIQVIIGSLNELVEFVAFRLSKCILREQLCPKALALNER